MCWNIKQHHKIRSFENSKNHTHKQLFLILCDRPLLFVTKNNTFIICPVHHILYWKLAKSLSSIFQNNRKKCHSRYVLKMLISIKIKLNCNFCSIGQSIQTDSTFILKSSPICILLLFIPFISIYLNRRSKNCNIFLLGHVI